MRPTLVFALVLASALTGCSSSHAKLIDAVVTQPSATGSTSSCEPTGTGTTDLTKKPVYTVPTAKAPAETTVVDIVCGTGAGAVDGSAVEVKYVGVNYADGKEFDSSWARGDTLPFTLGSGVIAGFSRGMLGMKVGGRREVVIPPKDGYGDAGPVPGGTLVFLIDLLKVG